MVLRMQPTPDATQAGLWQATNSSQMIAQAKRAQQGIMTV